jgi:hypothetical protein
MLNCTMKTTKREKGKVPMTTNEKKRIREFDLATKRINLAIPANLKEPLKARAAALCYSVQDYLIELARREVFGTGAILAGGRTTPPSPLPSPSPTLRTGGSADGSPEPTDQ